MGSEHTLFRGLGKWDRHFGTPMWALIAQGCLSLAIILLAGSFIDIILYTAPVVWVFFLVTGLSVFVLRHKEPETPREYRITAYPVTVIVFCVCCVFMFYSSVSYVLAKKPIGLFVSLSILLTGAFVYWLTDVRSSAKRK